MRDAGRHLTERRKPIAQALAFLELLHLREVLEEHHGAGRLPAIVFHLRQRVADDAVEVFQPQLGAIRQMAQLERAPKHADHVGTIAQYVSKRPADVTGRTRQPENSVRLVVHQREGAIALERDDTVAHAAHDVAE